MSSLTDYEDNFLAASPSVLLALALAADMGKSASPNYQPSASAMEDAFMNTDAVKDIDGYDFHRTKNPTRVDAYLNSDPYGSNSKVEGENGYDVRYNPEAHPAYLAHEMGHGAAQQTPLGQAVYQARTGNYDNPKLAALVRTAQRMGPAAAGAVAALTPGDDDLAASVLANYAAASPVIADELLASLKAEDILRQSHGGTMPRGSRIRLAGGLGTYLAAPALSGSVANYVGNLMDTEVRPPSNSANVA